MKQTALKEVLKEPVTMNTRFSFKAGAKWMLLFSHAPALLGLAAVFLVGLFR